MRFTERANKNWIVPKINPTRRPSLIREASSPTAKPDLLSEVFSSPGFPQVRGRVRVSKYSLYDCTRIAPFQFRSFNSSSYLMPEAFLRHEASSPTAKQDVVSEVFSSPGFPQVRGRVQ